MSAFVALLTDANSGAQREFVASATTALAPFGKPQVTAHSDGFTALVADQPPGRPPLHGTHANGTAIAGWARLDERDDLAARLGLNAADMDDGSLLLRAHERWGEALPEHLVGEFSFVVWDAGKRQLFAATDRFGTRPLFRMDVGQGQVFSDSLHVLRSLGGDALSLDEEALGDFACLAFATDPQTTVYREVRRLPPSCSLTITPRETRQRKYWRLDEPVSPLILKDDRDYVARFRELFLAAVSNRIIPGRPVGIMMSGGMDSTSVAAGAVLACGDDAARLVTAHTAVSESYTRVEGDLAQQTAARLGIGFISHDNTSISSRSPSLNPDFVPSQPGRIPESGGTLDIARSLANDGGVLLSGMAGDLVLGCRSPTIPDILRADGRRAPLTLLRHLLLRGRLPSTGLGHLRSRLAQRRAPEVPLFIDEQFARRTRLRERLEHYSASVPRDMVGRLHDPFWTVLMATGATSETGLPLEVAHPFADQRLIEFSRRIPSQLLRGKRILRQAMHAELPKDVLRKPKTLVGHATLELRRLPAIQARHMAQLERTRDIAGNIFDLPNLERCIASPQAGIAHSLAFSEALLWWLETSQRDTVRD